MKPDASIRYRPRLEWDHWPALAVILGATILVLVLAGIMPYAAHEYVNHIPGNDGFSRYNIGLSIVAVLVAISLILLRRTNHVRSSVVLSGALTMGACLLLVPVAIDQATHALSVSVPIDPSCLDTQLDELVEDEIPQLRDGTSSECATWEKNDRVPYDEDLVGGSLRDAHPGTGSLVGGMATPLLLLALATLLFPGLFRQLPGPLFAATPIELPQTTQGSAESRTSASRPWQRRRCPSCAEVIRSEAKVCKHCQREL